LSKRLIGSLAAAVRLSLAVGVLAAGASGCSPRPAPQTYRILVKDMSYGPAPAQVRVGDTIEWVNADIFRHTATARDGRFDLELAPGASGVTRLDRPGAVEIYCRYHPGMKLRMTVSG
jgi:plastocyanin